MKDMKRHVLRRHKDELRQTIIAAHSEAPCCTPDGDVAASKGDVWVKYQPAPGVIGQGDFGNVFKAKLRSTQEAMHGYRYAIKSVDLTTNLLDPEVHLHKCRREVQLMHACRHENVIPIYEFFEFYYENEPENFCMVMELGSESLTSVKDEHTLTEEQCLFILAKISASLKYIHSRGIVHRDVKPDNVMICFDGVPKLCDFGESTRLSEDGTCTGRRGSPMYRAPETGTGADRKAYGPKVDVFSFGITAAEVTKQGEYNLIRTNETNTHKAIRARVSHMSAGYQELVLSCVAFDPLNRPSSSDVYDSLVNGPAKNLDASCMANIVENFIH
ncbi:hypothetical protein AAVH_19438 [Aphelenchoides avenae]|nr:hypothetical protein AAVH_19438 [Aphelenchus avenae]